MGLNTLHAGNFRAFVAICWLLFFLNIFFLQKICQELYKCQTVWIQIRPDVLLVQILVQTVYKGYLLPASADDKNRCYQGQS